MTGLVVFVGEGTSTRVLAALVLNLFFLRQHIRWSPYANDALDRFHQATEISTLLTLVAGLCIYGNIDVTDHVRCPLRLPRLIPHRTRPPEFLTSVHPISRSGATLQAARERWLFQAILIGISVVGLVFPVLDATGGAASSAARRAVARLKVSFGRGGEGGASSGKNRVAGWSV
mmetsp:Transcript_67224/g.212879  ORF Transcript_67224/g.212879 Transcript_67224/m.212879 type:complete len:174 (-) Transcript_67224:28-549(-)